MCLVTWGKWAVRTVTVEVRKVGDRRGVVVVSKIGGDERDVYLTTTEVRERWVEDRGNAPGITGGYGDGEFESSQGGDHGPKRSVVGPFRKSVKGHVCVGG